MVVTNIPVIILSDSFVSFLVLSQLHNLALFAQLVLSYHLI